MVNGGPGSRPRVFARSLSGPAPAPIIPKAFITHNSGGYMRLTGYPDRFSARPGETIRLHVSSKASKYRAEIVRLIHGDHRKGQVAVLRHTAQPNDAGGRLFRRAYDFV